MTPAEAKKRIAELRQQVKESDQLYHGHAKPLLPDFEYDLRKRELVDETSG
jgi:NAD-dependent DNA ligase